MQTSFIVQTPQTLNLKSNLIAKIKINLQKNFKVFLLVNFAFFALFSSVFSGCATTTTGRSQLMLMNEDQEKQIGEQSAAEILKEAKISNNKTQTAQVRRVGQRIALAANKPDFEWEFHLLEDPTQNAFCLPGGKVFAYTGLMELVASDDELAVVMGHEVAHALLRHGAERASMGQIQNTLGGVLGVALDAFGVGQYKGVAGAAYNVGSNYAVMMPYSRSHELEADKLGVDLLIKAGYKGEAALSFWQKMSGGNSGSDFFSTHPSDEKRIQQINSILRKY